MSDVRRDITQPSGSVDLGIFGGLMPILVLVIYTLAVHAHGEGIRT